MNTVNEQKGQQLQLVLISHTNAGKTTLARTLIGMDIGVVRDAAHVTEISESHVLLRSDVGDKLLLWDTPGFGDSVRLVKRLAMAENPIGWILREVIDRYRDRPFWLSQQAVRTARNEADVVLYLVNSSENPLDATYLAPEMKVLEWLGKPVLVLLNQMGPPRPAAEEDAEQSRWAKSLAGYPVVRRVLPMDAFARCWVHERKLFTTIGEILPSSRQDVHARLLEEWERDNRKRFRESMQLLAKQLCEAARDSEALQASDKTVMTAMARIVGLGQRLDTRREKQAMATLMTRLEDGISTCTAGLLQLYRLDGSSVDRINERVQKAYVVRSPVDARQAGLLGAVLSGAATGLSADLMSGGLSLGTGALLGSIAGALTFAGAAWTFNTTTGRNEARVQFSDDFMRSLLVASVLRYLAVIHFGRGRGDFVEGEAPAFWQEEVETGIAAHEEEVAKIWRSARAGSAVGCHERCTSLLEQTMTNILQRLYPQ